VMCICSAHVAVDSVRAELNVFLALAFKGWAYGEDCYETNKCIDWSLTYAQVRAVCTAS
jgi:hypothetical protein